MDFINQLIQSAEEANRSGMLYSLFNVLGDLVAIPFPLLYCRRFYVGKGRTFFIAIVFYFFVCNSARLVLFLESFITGFQGGNVVAGFPLLMFGTLLMAVIFRVHWRNASDLLAPMPFVMHGFYRVACTFFGCCHGYLCDWGIYNPIIKQTTIPVQLFECMVSFGIVIFLLLRSAKRNFLADGKSLPIGMIIYGVTRFITEFLHDNEKGFLGFAATNIYALLMVIVGIVAICIIDRANKKKQAAAEAILA